MRGRSGRAGRRVWASVLALFVLATASAQAAEPKSRIRYAEPLALQAAAIPATVKLQRSGQPARIAFDAFGRRFDLELESNDRLLRRLPAARRAELPPHDLYRGRLAGLPGSWVRLTRLPDGLYGAIWDGSELYSIVPAHAAAAFMGGATPPTSDQPLIYRASDVDVLVGAGFCTVLDAGGRAGKPLSAGDQFKALLRELPRHTSATAAVATLELEVAMIGDFEFFSAETDPMGELLARVNIVDGIFSEQVGVKIAATEIKVFENPADPFTTSAPGLLLDEVGSYRVATPAIAAAGLAHLVTGRDLSGSTVGIAYLFGVCEAEIGVSLSERFFDPFTSALIAAHEFGHNLGAPHDAEIGSACRTTPPDFLMNPSINGSDRFSQCSLNQMAPVIAASSCIRQRKYIDVGVELVETRFEGHARIPVRIALDVVNHGTLAAESTRVSIALDFDLTATPISAEGGSCTTGAGNISCQMAGIPVGQRRRVEIDVTGSRVGSFFSTIAAVTTGDINPDNDHAGFETNLLATTDASIMIEPPADVTVLSGDQFDVSYLVRVEGLQSLKAASVRTTISQLTFLSADVQTGSCSVAFATVTCSLGDIAPGTTRRVTLHLRSGRAGIRAVRHSLAGTTDDTGDNNLAVNNVRVNPLVDLVVRAEPGSGAVRMGETFARSFTVLSLGAREARDASVNVHRSQEFEITGVTAEGASCVLESDFTSYHCRFSAPIDSGDSRRVDVNLRATQVGNGSITAAVYSPDNQHFEGPLSTQAYVAIQVRESADVRIERGFDAVGYDFRPFTVHGRVTSVGLTPAEAAYLTWQLPAGVTALSVTSSIGSCAITTISVRCDFGTLDPDATADVHVHLQADRPGPFMLPVEANAANDADPANNLDTLSVDIRPNIDIFVDPLSDDMRIKEGGTIRIPVTVRSASQPVSSVVVSFAYWNLEITSVTISQGSCVQAAAFTSCEIGTLPANSAVLIELDLLGVAPGSASISVDASGDQDIDTTNGSQYAAPLVVPRGNASVSAATPGTRPRVGESFELPPILVQALTDTESVELRIVVPPALTIEAAIPDIGQCIFSSGTVNCTFGNLAFPDRRNVSLRLRASQSGSFTAQAEVTADEDSDTSDNSASVTIDVDTAPSPPPPPSSGGGGGGSLDWLSLTLGALGLGVRRRRRIARSA